MPPVEGCRIERIHHIGPFVTRVDFRLPDGSPYVWTSRRHRWMGGVRAVSASERAGEIDRARWWLEVGMLARIGWWISTLFMVGSTCFVVASAAGIVPQMFGAFARDTTGLNLVCFYFSRRIVLPSGRVPAAA